MGDIVALDPKQKNVIPAALANLLPAAGPPTADGIPPEIAAAIADAPPALTLPKADPATIPLPAGESGPPALVPEKILSAMPDVPKTAAPPAPVMSAMGGPQTEMKSLATNPLSHTAPTVKAPPRTFGEKLALALNIAGDVGGAMEAAGNRGNAPGAERLLQSRKDAATQSAAQRKLDIEQQQADTNEGYRTALQSQYGTVPVQVPDPTDPTKTVTIQVQQKDAGKYAGTAVTARAGIQKTEMQQNGAYARELLKQGAPMNVDPELATLAGQPELAGKAINGATLANFIKTLNARGIGIKDLGAEGLWSVDKTGHRIRQVSIGSPSQMRGPQNHFLDVFDANGNLTRESEAAAAAQGTPSARAVMSLEGPTAQDKNMAHMAATVPPHLADLRADIHAHADLLGPFMGRLGKLEAGKWGTTGDPDKDYVINKILGEMTLAKSAVARTHFGGRTGPQAVQYFSDLFDMQKTPEGIDGVIDAVLPYMQGYAKMTNFTPSKVGASAPVKGGSPTATPSKPVSKKGDPLGIL